MANNYKRNLALLSEYNPVMGALQGMIGEIEDTDDSLVNLEGILYFRYEGNYYRLHSENRIKEAELLMKKVDPNKDHLIVLFGMGNAALLRKLLTETSDGTRIAVFEPNKYVFKYIVVHEDLSDMITSGKFAFIYGDEKTMDLSSTLYLEQKWDNLCQNLLAISLPNYYMYSEFRMKRLIIVTHKIDKMLKNLGTDLEDMLDGLSNNYRNVDACIDANGIGEITDKYKGYPAIIVASGPSLDKNIQYLKEAQGKALIITCDASYRACKANGVSPDMIASIERYSPTFQFFYENMEFDKDLVLVGPTLLWPEIYKVFPGKMILMSKSPIGLDGWWAKHFKDIEFVDQGMSCANVAYAVAENAGCDPIIVIGQDLAYTDEKVHSDQAHTEYEGANVAIKTPELDEIWVEDVNGNTVRTNQYYEMFRRFFEERVLKWGTTLIDATEGGARIQGSEVMTLKEAMDKYCRKTIPFTLKDLMSDKQITKEERIQIYKDIIHSAKDTYEAVQQVQDRAFEHYKVLLEYEKVDFFKASEDELIDCVMKMQSANDIINYIVEEREDLVSYYQQIVKATIIYVKKIGNDLTGENVQRNWQLQANLMYMLDIASAATKKRFEGLIQFIEDKIKEAEGEAV